MTELDFTAIHRMATPSLFAAERSGSSSFSAIESEARKSGVTNNTATRERLIAEAISARHCVPGLIF
jgi:hypothetical protein